MVQPCSVARRRGGAAVRPRDRALPLEVRERVPGQRAARRQRSSSESPSREFAVGRIESSRVERSRVAPSGGSREKEDGTGRAGPGPGPRRRFLRRRPLSRMRVPRRRVAVGHCP